MEGADLIYAEFSNEAFQTAARMGTPFLDPAVDALKVQNLIQRVCNVYAFKTLCLEQDQVTFTPIAPDPVQNPPIVGVREYDLRYLTAQPSTTTYTILSAPVCFVRQVMLNGTFMFTCDNTGSWGPSSEYLVRQWNPTYLTQTPGLPNWFWQESPSKLKFDRAFDKVYPNCFIQGSLYHSTITGNPNQVMDFGDEDADGAAELCAAQLLQPWSPEAQVQITGQMVGRMKERRGEIDSKQAGPQRRSNMCPGTVSLISPWRTWGSWGDRW